MSLITQCPACQTMFRVVPDQLRLSEGWVRCGQCDNVFDANTHIVQEPLAPMPAHAAAPMPMYEEPAALSEQGMALDDEALPPMDIKIDVDIPPSSPPPQFEPHQDFDHEAAPEHSDELVVHPPAMAHTDDEAGLAALSMVHDAAPLQEEPSAQRESTDEIALPPMEPPAPTFLRRPMPSVSAWHRTGVRVALSLLALVLLLLLGAQVALQERDRIAAMQPELKPVLNAACRALLGCSVAALKQIDGIVIDSSSFSKLRGDAYRLNLVVKNTAGTELATPAIELTLTDLQDKPVLRRVFQSREFDTPAATLAANGDWTATLAVNVKPGGGNERISGYRVLAFYP